MRGRETMTTYKVTVTYTVRESFIVKADTEEEAKAITKELDYDKMESDELDVISLVDVEDVEEI